MRHITLLPHKVTPANAAYSSQRRYQMMMMIKWQLKIYKGHKNMTVKCIVVKIRREINAAENH